MSLPLPFDQRSPSSQDLVDIDSMVHLMQMFNKSKNQSIYTSSFSSPSNSSSSSSTLLELISSSVQNDLTAIKQSNHADPYKQHEISMSEPSMSPYSPGSSSSCPSPKTVYSNLSTPTTISPATLNQNENARSSGDSVLFLNPFHLELSEVVLTSAPQSSHNTPSHNTPLFIEETLKDNGQQSQSYFPLREANIGEYADSISLSAPIQSSLNTHMRKRPTLYKHVTFPDPSCVPQLEKSKPFPHFIDENYWNQEHALASSQINDFDLMINSLVAQGNMNTLTSRKRGLSKTFEDIMPYLSGTSLTSQNTQEPFLHKRAKTENSLSEMGAQNIPWLINNGIAQIPSFGSPFKRQRSKTTSIVNALKDLPQLISQSNFSALKAGVDAKSKDVIDPTGVQMTTCKFIKQAAKTALKGVKSSDELEKRKKAIAGSKARDEQNREKSKRYYDRKKAQAFAMSELCKSIKVWQSLFGLTIPFDLNFETCQQYDQKSIKEAQKKVEAFQFKTLVFCAEKLVELLELQPSGCVAEIVLSHSNGQANSSNVVRSEEYMVLENGLHIWLDYLHCWADLVLAEKRLGQKTTKKPVYDLISSLTEFL